jgi:hypothetical protein
MRCIVLHEAVGQSYVFVVRLQDLARHLLHELANGEGRFAFASPSACAQLVELLSTDR